MGDAKFIKHIGVALTAIRNDNVRARNVVVDFIEKRNSENLCVRSLTVEAMLLLDVLLQIEIEVMQSRGKSMMTKQNGLAISLTALPPLYRRCISFGPCANGKFEILVGRYTIRFINKE
jgi:hypothetical protein